VDGLLSHVMIHEMRHTAQICVLLRTQGIKPPSLDLLFYLPSARATFGARDKPLDVEMPMSRVRRHSSTISSERTICCLKVMAL
jgi:DinB family